MKSSLLLFIINVSTGFQIYFIVHRITGKLYLQLLSFGVLEHDSR